MASVIRIDIEVTDEVAIFIVRGIVRLLVNVSLERAVLALTSMVAGDGGIVAENEVLHRVHQRQVARDILTA